MTLLRPLTIFALLGLLAATPSSNDDRVVVTKAWYKNDLVKYKAEHDIVNILVPINSLNFDEDYLIPDIIIFFVEADVQSDGSKIDQGLYVLKDRKATKLLNNGRDAAAMRGDGKQVYFGAKDGLYIYNPTTNSAEKYGTITDSIISIAKTTEDDAIYILTEDNVVYKVTNNGTKKAKVDEIEDAKQIVLDYSNNLYFYSDDKQPWVLAVGEDVKKIEGLPEATGDVALVKPPFVTDYGVAFVMNNRVYTLFSNGTSQLEEMEFAPKALPTAFAPEAALVQYYAFDKKIYEYDILSLLASNALDDMSDYVNKKSVQIQAISSKHGALKRKLTKQS